MRYNAKVQITSNYTANKWDDVIEADCQNNNVTITLPAISVDVENGHSIVIKRSDGEENLNELTVDSNNQAIYKDSLAVFNILQDQIVRFVYWDGLWVVEFSNIELEVWFDEIQLRSGALVAAGVQQNFVSFPLQYNFYKVDTVYVSHFSPGGRSGIGFNIEIGETSVLSDSMGDNLCQEFALDELLRGCETFQINVTSIPSPAPRGLRTAYRAVSYK